MVYTLSCNYCKQSYAADAGSSKWCSDNCHFCYYTTIGDENTCWLWHGPKSKQGYGMFGGTEHIRAHRKSYILFKGPIPKGHVVRHTCHNTSCVNPNHLTTGTQKDNSQDMVDANRGRRGMAKPLAKLTDDQVLTIFNSTDRQINLARQYGVSRTIIHFIRIGKTWRHVTMPSTP